MNQDPISNNVSDVMIDVWGESCISVESSVLSSFDPVPGQSNGSGGCSCAVGNHSQHPGLRGVSVGEPVSEAAPDGVRADGRFNNH